MHKKQGLFGIGDGIYLIIAPLLIMLPLSYWYFTSTPSGFCVAQNRFLTDAEYIKFVVPHELQRGQKLVNGKPVINCCSVDREGGFLRQMDDFTAKLFRLDKGVEVTWSYELSEEGKSMQFASSEDQRYVEIRVVDSCANVLLKQTGMATN